jgi:ankyrin repeat protein
MESQGPSDCAPDADGDRGGEESLAALHERLFAALKSGDLKAVRAAVEAGADLRWTESWSGRGVVFFAGSEEVVRYLIGQGFSIEEPIANGETPMVNAIEHGVTALEQLRALIACGANVNATVRGWTLFQRAARCPARDVAVLKVLIEAGADPHALTEYGWSAAHLAVDVDMEANCEESVRSTLGYLKEIGVDLNYGEEANWTPLEKAIQTGRALEVEVLCELGANTRQVVSLYVDDENIEGASLVALVVVHGGPDRPGRIKSLIAAGADPLLRDAKGFSARQRAVREVVGFFQDWTSDLTGSLEARYLTFEEWFAESAGRCGRSGVREYVEQCASETPRVAWGDGDSECARMFEEIRREMVEVLVLLCEVELGLDEGARS